MFGRPEGGAWSEHENPSEAISKKKIPQSHRFTKVHNDIAASFI
jgi:hypothetical protein